MCRNNPFYFPTKQMTNIFTDPPMADFIRTGKHHSDSPSQVYNFFNLVDPIATPNLV